MIERERQIPESPLFWELLVQLIAEGRVVPIVSKDLLTCSDGSNLYRRYATQLASLLQVPDDNLTPGEEINDLACRYIAASSERTVQQVHGLLKYVVGQHDALPIPVPLRQLAEIRRFQLFVSTTFDANLINALDQVRYNGEKRTRVVSYWPDRGDDLPQDRIATSLPTVFHLLGTIGPSPNCALTQWEMVEYFCSLIAGRPARLFDELSKKSLLILGASFDGWLARLFLRIAKGQLGSGSQAADYIADPKMSGDPGLVLFIRRLRQGTEIYSGGGAVEFVDKLHAKWIERYPLSADQGSFPSGPRANEPHAVFLSYAKEDAAEVARIKAALVDKGVDVFVDADDIQPGQEWSATLTKRIVESSLFIPIISRNSATDERRFFHREWRAAIDENFEKGFSSDAAYVVPVAIDNTQPNDHIPAEFGKVQWYFAPGGNPSEAFIEHVRELYRKYHVSLMSAGA